MPDIHAARRARLQEQAAELGADAALITSLVNVRYLTGLASSNAALLLPAAGAGSAAGSAVLATDSRYTPAAERDCPDLELVIDRSAEMALAALAAARGLAAVGFEEHEMTVERHLALASTGLTLVRSAAWWRACGWSRMKPRSRCWPGPARSPLSRSIPP
jgi:Xaa-Pro aminopeptidase